jgi:hypothetical protein
MYHHVIASLKNIKLDGHDAICVPHKLEANIHHLNSQSYVGYPALGHLHEYDADKVIRKLLSRLFQKD